MGGLSTKLNTHPLPSPTRQPTTPRLSINSRDTPTTRSKSRSRSRGRGGSKEQEQGHDYGREREQEQTETMGTKSQGGKVTRGQAPVVQDDENKSKNRLSPSRLVLSQDDLKGI